MAAETTQTMDAVVKIGYLGPRSKSEQALDKLRKRRLLDEKSKTQQENSYQGK